MARVCLIMLSIIMLYGCALHLQDKSPAAPRNNAAGQLAQEGVHHLSAGRPDNAIRSFEQAIGLNPNNGQNYYYLSEAWLMKGFAAEARQLNGLAESHLTGNKDWAKLVARQAERITTLEEKIKKSR